jgi:hypothetical protein
MTAGPWNETGADAGGHGRMRASHADREQVVEQLKVAFVQGRLDGDELDGRVGQALTARTYADLAALTADIPAERAPRRPAGGAEHRLARAGVRVTLAAGVLGVIAATVLSGGNHVERLIFAAMLLPLVALMAIGLLMFHSWLDKRGTGQLPSGPGPGGQGLDDSRSAGTARDRALPGDRADDTRADLRAHRPRPASSGRGMRPVPVVAWPSAIASSCRPIGIS